MADFTRDTAADIVADNPGINMGTSGSMREIDWGTEDAYWRANFHTRPYVKADRGYEHYEPAYRYGAEARARHGTAREWTEIEPELERGWSSYRGTSQSSWQDARDAARDAWERRVR